MKTFKSPVHFVKVFWARQRRQRLQELSKLDPQTFSFPSACFKHIYTDYLNFTRLSGLLKKFGITLICASSAILILDLWNLSVGNEAFLHPPICETHILCVSIKSSNPARRPNIDLIHWPSKRLYTGIHYNFNCVFPFHLFWLIVPLDSPLGLLMVWINVDLRPFFLWAQKQSPPGQLRQEAKYYSNVDSSTKLEDTSL